LKFAGLRNEDRDRLKTVYQLDSFFLSMSRRQYKFNILRLYPIALELAGGRVEASLAQITHNVAIGPIKRWLVRF